MLMVLIVMPTIIIMEGWTHRIPRKSENRPSPRKVPARVTAHCLERC